MSDRTRPATNGRAPAVSSHRSPLGLGVLALLGVLLGCSSSSDDSAPSESIADSMGNAPTDVPTVDVPAAPTGVASPSPASGGATPGEPSVDPDPGTPTTPEPPDPVMASGGSESVEPGLPPTTGGAGQMPTEPAPIETGNPICDVVANAPEPGFDVTTTVDWWESFVRSYPRRVNESETNIAAGEFLEEELQRIGYATRSFQFESNAGQTQRTVRAVEGTKLGAAQPDAHLALVAHYDVVPRTIEGAYDDGAGVALQLALCEMLAQIETNKSIACLFFDAEEVGLLGSEAYVENQVTGPNQDINVEFAFGFDMVGINWPGYPDWPLYAFPGFDESTLTDYRASNIAMLETLFFDCLQDEMGLSSEGAVVAEGLIRSADETRFHDVGIPVIRFAGGRTAGGYPQYHTAQDTVEFVYDFVGGRPNLELGFETAALTFFYTTLVYDSFDFRDLP